MINVNLKPEEMIITVSQAAEFLGLSERTIDRYRKSGLLPYYKPIKKVYIKYNDLLACLGIKHTKNNQGGINE